MRRLFTVGCSFTHFYWPTWADILGSTYDEYYNWGLSGLGNRAICERLAEISLTQKLTEDAIKKYGHGGEYDEPKNNQDSSTDESTDSDN